MDRMVSQTQKSSEGIKMTLTFQEEAGRLYCDLDRNFFTEDVAEFMRNKYVINVSTAIVSEWIDEYVHNHIDKLTHTQKDVIVMKKIIEMDGNGIDNILNHIKNKWGCRITHIRTIKLVSAYMRIKDNDEKIKEMLGNGYKIQVIATLLSVPKNMVMLLYGEKNEGGNQ